MISVLPFLYAGLDDFKLCANKNTNYLKSDLAQQQMWLFEAVNFIVKALHCSGQENFCKP